VGRVPIRQLRVEDALPGEPCDSYGQTIHALVPRDQLHPTCRRILEQWEAKYAATVAPRSAADRGSVEPA
jgi:hypothetical protein